MSYFITNTLYVIHFLIFRFFGCLSEYYFLCFISYLRHIIRLVIYFHYHHIICYSFYNIPIFWLFIGILFYSFYFLFYDTLCVLVYIYIYIFVTPSHYMLFIFQYSDFLAICRNIILFVLFLIYDTLCVSLFIFIARLIICYSFYNIPIFWLFVGISFYSFYFLFYDALCVLIYIFITPTHYM